MSENKIKVSASTTSKAVRVNVSAPTSQGAVTLSPDTSAYNANIAEQWAISEKMVLGKDYSSKYYANKAKESASNAQGFESTVKDIYNGFLGETTEAIENVQGARDEAIANIETSRVEAIDNITTVKSESIASVEAKSDEVLSTVNKGIAEINSTKTTILNDIEFVADGEKQEINDLADLIKDNADTVNTAIEAGIERLNSIDALKKSQITNCLLEVPQTIKLELNNGKLTLKAGSKVTIPNGAGVFDEVVVPADLSIKTATTGQYMLVLANTGNSLSWVHISRVSSGTTDSIAGLTYHIWYDTTNNVVNLYESDASVGRSVTLPVCIFTTTADGVKSIDQVFNGMGYIGSTIWVDKGVKGLIPNGRNADGSLNNIEFTTSGVKVATQTSGGLGRPLVLNKNGITTYYKSIYNEEQNYNLSDAGAIQSVAQVGTCDISNGVISNFQPKLPFRAVDSNDALVKADKEEIMSWLMPDYTTAVTVPDKTYTAPYKGWIMGISNISGTGNAYAYINDVLIGREDSDFISVFDLMDKGDVFRTTGTVNLTFCALKGVN